MDTGGDAHLEVILRGRDLDGSMGVFVFHHPVIPQNPPHAHHGFSKVLYVLDGDYGFRVGDAVFPGGPGTLVVVPQGSHHTFTTATGGRVLFVCSPSGNEEMFFELGKLGAADDDAHRRAVLARFQTRGLDGPEGRPWRPD